MQGLFFFVFSKYRVEERFSNIYLRNHAILWPIFGSQIGFDSQFQLREQLKKLQIPLLNEIPWLGFTTFIQEKSLS